MGPADGVPELTADCGRCFGLCCVALPFSRSADFAYDKPAGEPCVNLQPDSRWIRSGISQGACR